MRLNLFHESENIIGKPLSGSGRTRKTESNLKTYRIRCGISQRELSEGTGVPLRTIQQSERRRRNINAAKAETLFILSRYPFCSVEYLMEI